MIFGCFWFRLFAVELGLNTQNLPYKPVLQEGCW
jgi:hypothetical protein